MSTVLIKLQLKFEKVLIRNIFLKILTQNFAIGNFLNFVMSDEKDISSQIHEFHVQLMILKMKISPYPKTLLLEPN